MELSNASIWENLFPSFDTKSTDFNDAIKKLLSIGPVDR